MIGYEKHTIEDEQRSLSILALVGVISGLTRPFTGLIRSMVISGVVSWYDNPSFDLSK